MDHSHRSAVMSCPRISIISLIVLSLLTTVASAAPNHGFLRTDRNNRYFVFDDGTSYIPIGFNYFRLYRKTEREIDALMTKWAQHGINYIRVWVGLSSEPETKVGKFDANRMSKLDYIINKAQERGIYLAIAFWDENGVKKDKWWKKDNAYNRAVSSSGTATDRKDLYGTSDADTFAAMKNRYKTFVKRWQDKRSIMMWDLVNDSRKDEAWRRSMYNYVRSLDAKNHLITYQMNTGKDNQGAFDAGSVRTYYYSPKGNDPEEMSKALDERITDMLKYGDPVYVGEGRMNNTAKDSYRTERGFLHLLWGPMASCAAGITHYWVCLTCDGVYPDITDQQLKRIKGVSEFAKKIEWKNFDSAPAHAEVSTSAKDVVHFACRDDDEMLVYLMHDDASHQFNKITTTLKVAKGLKNGTYAIDWIDVRSGKVMQTDTAKSVPFTIDSPNFKDGVFAHIKPITDKKLTILPPEKPRVLTN